MARTASTKSCGDICVVANIRLKNALSVAKSVIEILEKNDVDFTVESDLGKRTGRQGVPLDKINAKIIICVGGDGTILRTAQRASGKILGINVGEIGFLTEIAPTNLDEYIKKLLDGDYTVDKRSKLKVYVDGERLYDCLNECVVHTAQISKMRAFNIYVDKIHVSLTRADGIIVATPTGSTCYAMSAGGPIIDTKTDVLLIQPLAPFKLTSRPLVVSAKSEIEITLHEPRSCMLVLDGQYEMRLKGHEVVRFGKSEMYTEFIRFGKFTLYDRIKTKLAKIT